MTRAEDLLKALNGLQKGADKELSGEAHQRASQHIKDLFRLAGFDGEDSGDSADEEAFVPFVQALAQVRMQAEGELSGNAFYIASKTLDELASLSSGPVSSPEPAPESAIAPAPAPAETAEAQACEPVESTPPVVAALDAAHSGLSFAEVSAAAKARVEEFAGSLGIQVGHHQEALLHDHHDAHDDHDALAGVELEKRSSEPCSMPEIAPIAVEAVTPPPAEIPEAPAPEVIEVASVREVAEAVHDFGTPAVVAGQAPEYAAHQEEPAQEPQAAPEIEPEAPSAPVPEEPAHVEPVVEPVPEQTAAAAFEPIPEPEVAPAAPAPQAVTKPEAAPAAPVQQAEAKPEIAARAPAKEASPAPAAKKLETKPRPQPEPREEQKTFFSLWLDMVFGRKK